eukprot:s1250_g11.t1
MDWPGYQACLEQLRDPGRPESTTPASVMQPAAAFVETLREIPKAMKDFLLNKVGDLDFQPSIEAEWVLEQPWLANRHRQALGYAVAWLASLLWCIRFRGSSSALCSILVAWQLPFTWVTLHVTLNEFLGTVGGVILGALPTFLLRLGPARPRAASGTAAHELFVCFSLMYILWTTATYYAQVQAFQWRVAALFWSCFGGVEMLRDFGLAEDLRSNIWKQQSWNSLVDFSVGCGLVFFCELVLGALCREAPPKSRAAQATAASLESCAKMVSSLQDFSGKMLGSHIRLGVFALRQIRKTLAHHHSRDHQFFRAIQDAMATPPEIYPWRCVSCGRINKKISTKCAKCYAHWTTGVRHNTEPKSVPNAAQQWETWTEEDQSWSWQNPYAGRQKSRGRSQGSNRGGGQNSPRARSKGAHKGNKGKGKGKPNQTDPAIPNVPKAMQPFGGKEFSKWAPGEQTTYTQSNTITSTGSSGAASSIQAQNQELVVALRKAYPDPDNTPEDVKLLIEKTEQDMARSITTNIHASTRALSKAQKQLNEAMEARRKHRTAWMLYMQEALKAWETSLDGYRRQQAGMQEAAAKARQDIAAARRAIELNAKAAGNSDPQKTLTNLQISIKEELEETAQEDTVDQEEEKLRTSIQAMLTACAGSLGLAPSPETHQFGPTAPVTITEVSDSEDEGRQQKRPRSKDPGGKDLPS